MNIKIHYTRHGNLPVEVTVLLHRANTYYFNKTIVTEDSGIIDFNCIFTPGLIELSFVCSDPNIYHAPITIDQFELDNFYQLVSFVHHGHNLYDSRFVDFIKANNIFVDNVEYSNCLFFTGKLLYNWQYPFSQMIFKHALELVSPQ